MRLRTSLFGCALASLLVGVSVTSVHAALVVSEVLWSGSDLSTNDEWIEVTCPSFDSDLCDFSGWTLTSVNTSGSEVTVLHFETGATLLAGESAVIARLPSAQSALAVDPRWMTSSMTLPNTKLHLRLRNQSGILIDEVDDEIGAPFAGSNGTSSEPKASMTRVDLSVSGTLKENWMTSITQQGIDAGAAVLGTPGYFTQSSSSSPSASSSSSSSSSLIQFTFPKNCELQILISPELKEKIRSLNLIINSESGSILLQQTSENPDELPASILFGTGAVGVTLEFLQDEVLSKIEHEILNFACIEQESSSTNSDQSASSSSSSSSTLCLDSPGTPVPDTWSAELSLQSGSLEGQTVTLNPQVVLTGISSTKVQCTVDFGDGLIVSTCNPGSHSYKTSGQFILFATVKDVCGTTVTHSLTVRVLGASSKSSSVLSSEEEQSPYSSATELRLLGVLPNPEGTDKTSLEWIELKTGGSLPASLGGWWLSYDGKRIEFPANLSLTQATTRITAAELSMSLRNISGSLILHSPDEGAVSEVQWNDAQPGQVLTAHEPFYDGVQYYVTHVVDGDTFDVRGVDQSTMRVRLLGVDAPEMDGRTSIERNSANESFNFLRALIENKNIELFFDTDVVDMYGRTLAYVRSDSGKIVQEELLKSGHALVYRKAEFRERERYLALEAEASLTKLGIWIQPSIFIQESEKKEEQIKYTSSGKTLILEQKLYSVFLSEILLSPANSGDEWIEIRNTGTGSIDLQGWSLDDVATGGSKPWVIDRPMIVKPGGYVVFPKSVTKLSLNDTGDDVLLLSPTGTLVDYVKVPKLKKGTAYARAWKSSIADEDFCMTTTPTEGYENVCPVESLEISSSRSSKAASRTTKKATTTKVPKSDPLLADFRRLLPLESPVTWAPSLPTEVSAALSLPQALVLSITAVLAGGISGFFASALRKTV